MGYKEIILLIIAFFVIILVIWYNIYFLISCFSPMKRAPTVSSFDKDLKLMKNLKLGKWKKILDLGCSNWKALRFFESEFDFIGEWYDINFFAVMWWRLLNKIKWSKVKLFWANFFKADLKRYDYVYVYLLPVQMWYIEDRLFESISKKTIIISNTFEFKKNQPFEIIKTDKWKSRIYIYRRGNVKA